MSDPNDLDPDAVEEAVTTATSEEESSSESVDFDDEALEFVEEDVNVAAAPTDDEGAVAFEQSDDSRTGSDPDTNQDESNSADTSQGPESQPALSKRSRVAQGLESLFSGETEAIELEPVPGASDSLRPPGPSMMPDIGALAEELSAMASEQSSALAKSRGLFVASQLFSHVGNEERSFDAARIAAETSPKLALASLALRKKATARGDQETLIRSLEATARQASQSSSRAHAIRLLAEVLNEAGRTTEMGQLLDQAARSGDADDALLLLRLVHRLSQGATLAGVEVPDRIRDAVAATALVISGTAKTSEEGVSAFAELAVVRAARYLRDNDTAKTIETLRQTKLDADALTELHAALIVTEPGGTRKAEKLLRDVALRAPSTRILRRLAKLAVHNGDASTILTILDQADPGSGTFSLAERWFLAATAGQPLQLGHEDMLALSHEHPALAMALGPSDSPAANTQEASSAALLAQVGAGLAWLRSAGSQPLTAPALEALAEIKERGLAPEMRAALDLITARTSDNNLLWGESLLDLSDHPDRASGQLIAAALLHKAGAVVDAERGYRGALTGSEGLASSASRGLVALNVEDGIELLRAATSNIEDPKLSFAHKMLAALQSNEDERGALVLDAVQALYGEAKGQLGSQDDAGSEGDDGLEERTTLEHHGALLLAAASTIAMLGDAESARQARGLMRSDRSKAGSLARLRAHWEGETPEAGSPGFDDTDPSERALRFWTEEESPRDTQGSADRPASEILLHLARGLATDHNEHAAHLGSLCSEVDGAAGAIGIDIQKLLGNNAELSPIWLDRAKSAEDPASRRFAYERLAELDEQKGDHSSALLWHRSLAEEFPDHIASLLRLEEILLSQGVSTSAATDKLSQALPEGDREKYQLIFGARALAQSDLRTARKHLEPLLDVENPPLLAIRGVATIAHDRRDDALLLRAYGKLVEHRGTDLDKSAAALTLALIHARLGNTEEAVEWCRKSITEKPGAFAAHQLLHHLSEPDDALERADQLEAFGLAAATDAHRVGLFFAAGQAFDEAEDPNRAADCYERTLNVSPDHQEAFELLCQRREAHGALDAVEKLIISRLSLIKVGSNEQLGLELKLAELLSSQDRPEEAKKHLEEALTSHPGHSGALRAHANVSAQLGAHASAEKSLVALRDRLEPGEERTEVMRSLARLYDEHLGQTEKAMDAYQAILTETPGDERTSGDLVRIYSQLGLAERATALQTKLIQAATSPEKKRDGALQLAKIYETVASDPQRAGATLERTRKAWPLDGTVLQATVEFMDRQGTGGPRGFLLDRAGKDARRKLETGRLDGALLDTLARVARLSGQTAAAESTEAARHAFIGTPHEPLKGAGLKALDPNIDEIIAPRGLPAPLRLLLRKTGAAMDAAFSVDLANMGARPLTSGTTFERMEQIAKVFGTDAPALFVSDSLGAKCLPITTEPARLLIGADLDAMPERERDYLLLRALKLRWLGAGALARSKDEDRWPMLVALLHLFAPNWRPTSVDGRKAAQAKALIEQGLARVGYDDDVPMLALEVIGALGTQGATVADQPRVLANRVALLGIGDPATTLSAIALAEGTKLASGGPSRFRWLESHTEAKDLVLFSTTDKCARAREALGLAEPSTPLAPAPPMAPRGGPPPRAPAGPPSRAQAPPSRAQAAPSGAQGAPPAPRRSVPPAPPRRPKPPPPKR